MGFNLNMFTGSKSPEFSAQEKQACLDEFMDTINDPEFGFFHITDANKYVEETLRIHKKFKNKTHFVQIGIGGSALGPETLISALQKNKNKFTFINNIDPDFLSDQLEDLDLESCLFYVVSKSGGTAETMASMAIIVNLLKEAGINSSEFSNYFVFCTDPENSQLLTLSKEYSIDALEVPQNVGGRFSVLTPVGFLPAVFAGIDIEALCKGANNLKPRILNSNIEENEIIDIALKLKFLLEEGFSQTVFMPYSSKLRDFSFWFAQLWAESLGKKFDKNGKQVNIGITPVASYGATDQHSQMQLFMEGPYDKVLFLIEVDKFDKDFSLDSLMQSPTLEKLRPYKLSDLIKAELHGSIKALTTEKRPYLHLKIDQNDELHLGSMIIFFEALTAIMGNLLNINAFDQPGVEAGKVFAFEWLQKK